jgi:hypothetical protein
VEDRKIFILGKHVKAEEPVITGNETKCGEAFVNAEVPIIMEGMKIE